MREVDSTVPSGIVGLGDAVHVNRAVSVMIITS